MLRQIIICGAALVSMVAAPAMAQQGERFEIEEVVINGLDRVAAATVLAQAGFGRGDVVDESILSQAIGYLYETGLFRDIEISHEGATVIIEIVENPTINSIRFVGLTELDEDKVLDLLEGQDIAPGRIFKRGDAEFINAGVTTFYRQVSRYLAFTSTVSVPLEGNRVDLVVQVTESEEARIGQINLHGVEAFDVDDLVDLFELREGGIVSSLFDRDAFSQQAFDGDLQLLRNYYASAGYIRFEVLSSDVRVNSATGDIDIDIFVSEGARYSFSEPRVIDNEGALAPTAVNDAFFPGDTFSDQLVEKYRSTLLSVVRDKGYAFAEVQAVNSISDEGLSVGVTYTIYPGKLVYVRQINFSGNNITRDDVLRRQMELLEGELFSEDKLEYSMTRLRRTSYLLAAQASEVKVADDLVDIDVSINENNRGTSLIGVGYSSADELSFKFDLRRNNILGTGNDLRLVLRTDDNEDEVDLLFHEANITDSGISRDIGLFYSKESPDDNAETDRSFNKYGLTWGYTIPLDRVWSWSASLEGNRTKSNNAATILGDPPGPNEITDESYEFIERYGDEQDNLLGSLALLYDTRDRALDPTSGTQASLGTKIAVPGADTEYYQAYLTGSHYRIIGDGGRNVITIDGQVRYGSKYGDGIYPYYERYLVSARSLRGFDPNSTGLRDSDGTQIGGKFLVASTTEVLRQLDWFDGRSVRGGVFLDIAGLWNDWDDFSDNTDRYRVSAGILIKINTPVFPLSFTYGVPLKDQHGDEKEQFQFRIGS